jgi:hypothetical protein
MSRWQFALLLLLPLGCESEQIVPAGTLEAGSASGKKPVDRLAPGELAPGRAEAFGLLLPRDLAVDARFPDAVHASGAVSPPALASYVRARVDVAHVEIAPARTVFPRVKIKGGDPARVFRIELIDDGPRSRLVIRDITPPPTVQGISEEERWRRAGMTPSGEIIDPTQRQ